MPGKSPPTFFIVSATRQRGWRRTSATVIAVAVTIVLIIVAQTEINDYCDDNNYPPIAVFSESAKH